LSESKEEVFELSQEILSRAVVLSGEPAWKSQDAIEAVKELHSKGYAVLGVELWIAQGSSPKWIATSNYNFDDLLAWEDVAQNCKDAAIDFIAKMEGETKESLFNLTWTNKEEFFNLNLGIKRPKRKMAPSES